jgi:putative flippase GtrA
MTSRRLVSYVMNGLAAVLIAFAIFVTLANVGLIARPSASEHFSFGG